MILLLLACKPPAPALPEVPTYAAAVHATADSWSITYTFSHPQSALLFDSSHGSYRGEHWSVEKGTELVHLSGLDAVFFDPPVTTTRFTVTPPDAPTEGPVAFLPFSDGSQAFWLGQLNLLTIEDRAAAEALDGNLSRWRGTQPPVAVTVTSDLPLLGPQSSGPFSTTVENGSGPYVYAGSIESNGQTLVDPGLPTVARETFETRFPEVLSTLETQWEQEIPPPTAWLAWAGAEEGWANQGRAQGAQISMVVRGDAYVEGKPDVIRSMIWFFAHELVHHHQFLHNGRGPTWMIEGFADTQATEALARMGLYDQGSLDRRTWEVSRECARELTRGPLAGARGRVAYVCGDIAGLAITSMLPDHSLASAWKLARAAAAGEKVTNEQLFSTLRAMGAAEEAVAELQTFVTEHHENTDQAIGDLLTAAGAKPIYVNGGFSTMTYPPSYQPQP